MRRTPALIVGGGPAGATLALRLALAGAPHLLVERTRTTGDALCGGFLSWRTLAMLERLGVAGAALNPTVVTRVRLHVRGRVAEAALPYPARAVSRHRLDTVLMAAALRAGAAVERGVAVRAIDGLDARLDDGTTIAADALFLANGKHDVRGEARPATARGADPTLGLRVRLAASPALDRGVGDAIELFLFDRGYAGLVRQEDGSANLCLAVRRSRWHDAGDAVRLLTAIVGEVPTLGDRLADGTTGGDTDAIANVPYGWRATTTRAALFRLGDQAGVIPSLAGEGMAIAIASGIAAADAFLSGGPGAAEDYQRRFAARLRRPIAAATIARDLAERPAAAALGVRIARLVPALLPLVARATRI